MTNPRSFLFIPGDSEKKLEKADATGADALILDLEDSVSLPSKPLARELVPAFLHARPPNLRQRQLWVRVNSLGSGLLLDDLIAVLVGAPDGIMLPKVDGPQDVLKITHYLDALEAQAGIEAGSTKLLPVATETAIAPFTLGEYAQAGLTRLYGLTWGQRTFHLQLEPVQMLMQQENGRQHIRWFDL